MPSFLLQKDYKNCWQKITKVLTYNQGGDMMEKLQFKVGTKDESIRLRLTKEEKKIIKDLAAEKGLTLTDLVKYAINKVIEE